jgi:hypothetical protein
MYSGKPGKVLEKITHVASFLLIGILVFCVLFQQVEIYELNGKLSALRVTTAGTSSNLSDYRYNGNMLVTAFVTERFQGENITGLYLYEGMKGVLRNKTDTNTFSEQPSSFIIFTNGTYYYAKNGITGQIDFSGTDASTVIQAAIKALRNGGRILVKSGVYQLSRTITDNGNDNIILEGEGWSTVFTVIPNFAHEVILISSGRSGWVLRNFKVDCTNQADLGQPGINVRGNNVIVENVYVTMSSHGGIDVSGNNYIIRGNYLINNRNDGIIARGSDGLVEGNVVIGTQKYNGISVAPGKRVSVIGNTIMNTSAAGIGVEYGSSNVLIQGNKIYNTGGYGINLYQNGGNNIDIVGNLIVSPSAHGIIIHNNQYVNIVGNLIVTPNGHGIYSNGTNVNINGNYILHPSMDGIRLDTGQASIVGNYIYAPRYSGIELHSCSSFIVSGNFFIM